MCVACVVCNVALAHQCEPRTWEGGGACGDGRKRKCVRKVLDSPDDSRRRRRRRRPGVRVCS